MSVALRGISVACRYVLIPKKFETKRYLFVSNVFFWISGAEEDKNRMRIGRTYGKIHLHSNHRAEIKLPTPVLGC